ncbi:hypothetical protein [Delftia sp. GW456-R20]|uniref:hypothetical protein n=1 Tax=Delftia sp. GW456-R20 TaxID=1827145 RepID=UPI0012E72DCC|nr:hypothetical protein [Delftia sp. GW456-R20]
MNKLEFIRILDAGNENVSDKTADLWFHILQWVKKMGYADTADTPAFVEYVQDFRNVEIATIARHLARLADAGFLDGHFVRRKLPKMVREELESSISAMIFGHGPSTLPASFKRYTLPGASCPLELSAVQNMMNMNESRDREMLSLMPSKFS